MFKLRKNKKGFTLVEIIIVIVIVAILAAITVPTMLGFVEKANEQQYIAEARSAYVVAQAIAAEKYAKDSANKAAPTKEEILEYLGDTTMSDAAIIVTLGSKSGTGSENSKVATIAYTRNGYKVTITASDNTVKVDKVLKT